MIYYQQEFQERLQEIAEIFTYDEETGEESLIDLHSETLDKIRDLNLLPVPVSKTEEMIFLQKFRTDIEEVKEKYSLEYEINEDENYADEEGDDTDFYFSDDIDEDDDYGSGTPTSHGKIDPFEETIWNYITNSAKRRFPYEDFAETFKELHDPLIPENLLWDVIQHVAAGKSDMEIKSNISMQLILLGYQMPDDFWSHFITSRRKDLGLEILATQIATDSLNHGSDAAAVLGQVNTLLR